MTNKPKTQKPDLKTAMRNIIELVKADFPFDAPEAQICGDTCVGCPRKLIELVESELLYWESYIERGETPNFSEIDKFAKLCKNVRRGLVRNGILEPLPR
ncbi:MULTISPECIES: hypothetical protein [Aliivibrio]|uniref:Uncharacterized protein n=1 Tax=Aliivibrio finisterrensis TaxID=511998 RepID=A0A4Q5KXW5_9GAMM|nr:MULTISPECIES: hypothetical protein [Aliivibrio]MDD9174764.1 hypothetical protein [Aliivibrio sp. S3TY1]MDD9179045.1 hypothetical protein [Aliivibrio sp. A6]MDD9191843.1 hypothetical protein [Aliivibrio sp. S2TY2]RYU48713.1 hypothetical protein ERW49_01725 [Aliivibrio finisterrensis]RYU51510.1 hypothetical protein ERW57_09045 [Aliivibrio finisterrensis]